MSLATPHCTCPPTIFVIVVGRAARGGGDPSRKTR